MPKSIKTSKTLPFLLILTFVQICYPSFSEAGGPPKSLNASCAALVTNVAKNQGSNLGLVFQLLKKYGWDIEKWPQIAKTAVKDETGCD